MPGDDITLSGSCPTNNIEQCKSKEAGKKFSESFKKALPKVGKYATGGAILGTVSGLGGFGLLGSLFLPGGPIGGALVGSAVAFASISLVLNVLSTVIV